MVFPGVITFGVDSPGVAPAKANSYGRCAPVNNVPVPRAAPSSEDPKLIIRVINFQLVQPICSRYINVTDGRTDRRTDGRFTIAIPRAATTTLHRAVIKLETTGYTALPSPPRLMRHACSCRSADRHTHCVTALRWLSQCLLRSLSHAAKVLNKNAFLSVQLSLIIIIIPSLQLGTVTLAGWLAVGKSCRVSVCPRYKY